MLSSSIVRSLKKIVFILACFIFITDELDDVFQLDETQAEQSHTSENTCNRKIIFTLLIIL